MVHAQRIFKPGLVSLGILEDEMLQLFFFFLLPSKDMLWVGYWKELDGLAMGPSSLAV